jgi:hypothetical protein
MSAHASDVPQGVPAPVLVLPGDLAGDRLPALLDDGHDPRCSRPEAATDDTAPLRRRFDLA